MDMDEQQVRDSIFTNIGEAKEHLQRIEDIDSRLEGITDFAFSFKEGVKAATALFMVNIGSSIVFDDIRPAARKYSQRTANELFRNLIKICNEKRSEEDLPHSN